MLKAYGDPKLICLCGRNGIVPQPTSLFIPPK